MRNLHKTSIVQNAVRKYGFPHIHGWVYDLKTGKIKDLDLDVALARDFHPVFHFE